MVERITKNFLSNTSYGDKTGYEIKKNEVKDENGLVFLYLVTGMKNDDGTMAAIFCRVRGHFMITKRGKVEVLSMESGTNKILKKHHRLYWRYAV